MRNAAQNYRKIDSRYITVDGRTVTIDGDYLASLPEAKSYVFVLESGDEILTFNVSWSNGGNANGNNTALVVSLSVVFGVLAASGAAALAVFLIRRKKGAAKREGAEQANEETDRGETEDDQ